MSGILYIVATPIGNLADITARAIEVLKTVDLIAAEDTRHSARLLQAHGIQTSMCAYHNFNETHGAAGLLEKLARGLHVALISDAGTPLISDPGYRLVREARNAGYKVVPVPGASAVITALSCAGLPSDRFVFEGFLPAKNGARLQRLQCLLNETRTMIFFEAPHRIVACLEAMVAVFGADREAVLARELTKTFETVLSLTLEQLLGKVSSDPDQEKGEIVLLVAGATAESGDPENEAIRILEILLAELPLKQSVALASGITGLRKNRLYELAIKLQESQAFSPTK